MTVCEFPDEARLKDAAWERLKAHCAEKDSDVVVLPEMPFCDWTRFLSRKIDISVWAEAVTVHDGMLARMGELGVGTVLASRPVNNAGRRLNQGFSWTPERGYRGSHCPRTIYVTPR